MKCRIPLFIAPAVIFTALIQSVAHAQVGSFYQLNGPLNPLGDVEEHLISPDGNTVVYTADQNTDNLIEIFSVPIVGGRVTNLSPTGAKSIDRFEISRDSSQLIYTTVSRVDSPASLYRVSINGGIPIELAPNTEVSNCSRFTLTPDNRHVICVDRVNGVDRLVRITINDGSTIELAPNLELFASIQNVKVSPDGSHVVYHGRGVPTNANARLFSAPLDGGPGSLLDSNTLRSTTNKFDISSDSSTVVFTDRFRLYSVPIAGGAVSTLSPPESPTRDRINANFQISQNSRHVIFFTEGSGTARLTELFSVSIDGSSDAEKISREIIDAFPRDFQISPDSEHVIYWETSFNVRDDLFSVPIEGGIVTQLSQSSKSGASPRIKVNKTGGAPILNDAKISADSGRVIYRRFLINGGVGRSVYELFSVPITGGAIDRLSISAGNVTEYQISPDSSRVVYLSDQDTRDTKELFSVSITGGQFTKLNGVLSSISDVKEDFKFSSDGTYIVYSADQDVLREIELYAHQLNGPLRPPTVPPVDPGPPPSADNEVCVAVRASSGSVALVCF